MPKKKYLCTGIIIWIASAMFALPYLQRIADSRMVHSKRYGDNPYPVRDNNTDTKPLLS